MIPVTKPFLPPKSEYLEYLSNIWERNWLTNNGPFVNELELKLKKFLGLDHLLYVSNGTIALQLAIKALGLMGEIITTPFSYIATCSSIVWEGCTPIFVDIMPEKFTIDPIKIEQAITSNTTAILATHVYGIPCDVVKIQEIADRYNLKVIYDAAHAFGVKVNGKSIFNYGDISTCSFHATKIFHTIEGGAVISKDPELIKKLTLLRNFGHDGFDRFNGVGINGKNSEFHAAMGILNLKYINEILEKRKIQFKRYDQFLHNLEVRNPSISDVESYNFSYYPIVFNDEEELIRSKMVLEDNNIGTRRYFFPSLNSLDYVPKAMTPICDEIAKRVLCLPLYHTISQEEQLFISRILLRVQNYK